VVRRAVGNQMIYGVGEIFHCSDGQLMVCSFGDALFARLCKVIERADLLQDPELKTDMARYERREKINHAIQQWLGGRSVAEAHRMLADRGVPAGKVEGVDAVLAHPQTAASGMIVPVEQPGLGEVPMAASALRCDGEAPEIERHAPAIGEHNDEFYDQLFGPGAASRLRAEDII
jgi:crotonobetainyl-CoA:carnitine CoA-transferase CaiB-like acyl-CoA transferase